MAESLVASLSSGFEPHKYHDEYREQVMALIQMKADGEEWQVPEAVTAKPNVIDIMAALEASVAAAKESRQRHPTSPSVSVPSGAGSKQASAASSGRTKADVANAAKKSAAKRRVAKPTAGKKAAGKKAASTKRPAAKSPAAKKSAAKRSATKKATSTASAAKRPAPKKATTKKSA